MNSSDDIRPNVELLVDEQSCSWRERDVDLRDRGIRLSWLTSFVESIYRNANEPLLNTYRDQLSKYDRAVAQQKASLYGPWDNIPWVAAIHPEEPKLLELTTHALVAEHVIPLTQSLKAPLYARVPPSHRGKPTVFLSHAWDAVILSLPARGRLGTLDGFGPGVAGVTEEFVWIDFVCYNQHKLMEEAIAFDMESIVQSIGKVSFAVTPVPLFNRIWCLWELLSVSRNDCVSQFCAAPGYRTDKRVIVNDFLKAFTSVTTARATKSADYNTLMSAIVGYFGSTEAADNYIMDLMKGGMGDPWFGLNAEHR
jgi:hypothetical protein